MAGIAARVLEHFGVRPDALTVLDLAEGAERGEIAVTRLPKGAFRGVEAIVDFVFDGAARELADAILERAEA